MVVYDDASGNASVKASGNASVNASGNASSKSILSQQYMRRI